MSGIISRVNNDIIETYQGQDAQGDVGDSGVLSALASIAINLNGRGANVLFPPIPYAATKGDGIADDLSVLQSIVNNFDVIVLPKPQVKYLLNGNLRIPANKTILSSSPTVGGNAELYFASGYGIISDGRFSTLKDITISTSVGNTGTAILFQNSTGTDHHFLTFKNLIINNFQTGLKSDANNFLWNCTFKDIRMNNVQTGLSLGTGSSTSFGLKFERIYFNGSTTIMNLTGVLADFDSCNFGINNLNAISMSSNSDVNFINCNFECDQHITGTGEIFKLTTKSVSFKLCSFSVNTDSTVSVIGIYGNMQLIQFDDCNYTSVTGNAMTDFFSKGASSTNKLFIIKFKSNSDSIPRPNYYNAQMANFIDLDNNILPAYNTSVPKTNMKAGMVFWHTSLKKPVYYDGTNIYDFTGATVTT